MNKIISNTIRKAVAFTLALAMLLCIPVMPGMAGYEAHADDYDVEVNSGLKFNWTAIGISDYQDYLTDGAIVTINRGPASDTYTLDLGENNVTVIGPDKNTIISGVAIETSASAITLQALNIDAGYYPIKDFVHGLHAKNSITISALDGVTIKGADAPINPGNGIFADKDLNFVGDITAVGGSSNDSSGNGGNGIRVKLGEATISGAAISVTGGYGKDRGGYGIQYDGNKSITLLSSGNVTAKGGNSDKNGGCGIWAAGGASSNLEIVANSVYAKGGDAATVGGIGAGHAIKTDGKSTITATSITAEGGDSKAASGGNGIYAVFSSISLTGDVKASGGNGGQRGGLGIFAEDLNDFDLGKITINGNVDAKGGSGKASAGGIAILANDILTISGSTISAKGGDSDENDGGNGINGDVVSLTGNVTAKGGHTKGDSAYGGNGIGGNNLTITGDVNATGGNTVNFEAGTGLITDNNMELSGASIRATGGKSTNGEGGIGIKSGAKIKLSGANIRATGGESTNGEGGIGIKSGGGLEITGNATATGGKSTNGYGGIGIFADQDMVFGGVQVTARGGESTSSAGGFGMDISVSSTISIDSVLKSIGGAGSDDSLSIPGGKSIVTSKNGTTAAPAKVKFESTKAALIIRDGGASASDGFDGTYTYNGYIIATKGLAALQPLYWKTDDIGAIYNGKASDSAITVTSIGTKEHRVWLEGGNPVDNELKDTPPQRPGGSSSGTTQYTITAEAGNGGKISPNGKVSVAIGGEKKFTFTPDDGYKISDVLVDGKSVGTDSTYTFKDVQRSHTIKVTFVKADIDGTLPFSDIENHWAKDNILNVYEKGLMNGTGDGKFSPNDNMTRGMAATIIGRFFELENGMGIAGYTETVFADVLPGKYYFTYVNWGADKGILNGTGTNAAGKPVYEPENFVTREQMAKLVDGLLKTMNIELDENSQVKTFTDQDSVSDWARESVLRMQSAGIITGRTDGSFDPQGLITRAEAAAMLERIMKLADA